MIIRAANALAEARRVGKLAGHATVQPDWSVVARRIREEATDNWNDTAAVEQFTGKGGQFVRGHATVTGGRTVVVDGREFRASRGLVLAAGTRPAVPPVEGLAGAPYWTNREALEAKQAPASLTIAGGGTIGVELAPGVRQIRERGHDRRGRRPVAAGRGAGSQRTGRRGTAQGRYPHPDPDAPAAGQPRQPRFYGAP
jgi:pyruvate/2-oxoglutarate dehydrogenase complex dihydrolipoamide dehydrogenase (E3) component